MFMLGTHPAYEEGVARPTSVGVSTLAGLASSLLPISLSKYGRVTRSAH